MVENTSGICWVRQCYVLVFFKSYKDIYCVSGLCDFAGGYSMQYFLNLFGHR